MSDADASSPTDPGPAEPAPAADPAPGPAPVAGLTRPALAPLVTLGSDGAEACSDGQCL